MHPALYIEQEQRMEGGGNEREKGRKGGRRGGRMRGWERATIVSMLTIAVWGSNLALSFRFDSELLVRCALILIFVRGRGWERGLRDDESVGAGRVGILYDHHVLGGICHCTELYLSGLCLACGLHLGEGAPSLVMVGVTNLQIVHRTLCRRHCR